MKLHRLPLFGALLLGIAATATTAMSSFHVEPGVPDAPLTTTVAPGFDGAEFLRKLYSPSAGGEKFRVPTELGESSAAEAEDADAVPVNCGDAIGVVTPDNGMSGQGWGATEADAIVAAGIDVLNKLWQYSGVKCAACPNPGECVPFLSMLDAGWEIQTFKVGGQWQAVITYKGAYLAGCTPCEI